jgi:ACS family tartrate transporter-like MFS transporter
MQPGASEASYRRTLWRLLLPIALLTFINALDRMNVSFAGSHMSRDLGLSPADFGLGVSTFFIAYLIFQYPHAWLLRRFGIRRWLFASMVVWGVSGLLMARVETLTDFLVARFLLGMAEAGFAPGMTWYIGQWTAPEHRAKAMAVALSAVPFSLVVGGPLCGMLLGMANPLDIAPWRWMFLVSALPNFVFAIIAALWFADPPSPAAAHSETGTRAGEASPARDVRVALCAVVWLLVMTGSYALVYWLPQIVRQLAPGQGEGMIGLLSALPQAALVAGLYLNARHSDRRGERLHHTAAGALLAGIALLLAVQWQEGPVVLGLLTLAGFGIGATQGVFWALPPALGIGGGQVPLGVIAAISMAGTAGGVIGPYMLGVSSEHSGSHALGIAVLACLLLLAAGLLWSRPVLQRMKGA